MQFFTLYTPTTPMTGRMDPEHMARMTKLTQDMERKGALVANGALMSRNTGMKAMRKNGKITIENGPVKDSTLMPAAGFAVIEADSREELEKHVKAFLEVAGDGTTEVIQVLDTPPRQNA